jgi:hypothetical protein
MGKEVRKALGMQLPLGVLKLTSSKDCLLVTGDSVTIAANSADIAAGIGGE